MSAPQPIRPEGPPLPGRPIMAQWWRDLVFLHWRVEPARLAPMLPAGTRPDEHDGAAWVGLVPFRMVDAGVGEGPGIPYLGTFLETNVRTYAVDRRGRRGVVFLSLDCGRLAAVLGARLGFGTPYFWAATDFAASGPAWSDAGGPRLDYRNRRRLARSRGAGGRIVVRAGSRLESPDPLDHFLTARFGLHTRLAGRTRWVPNTHTAWPLHSAEVLELDDSLVAAAGLPGVADRPPDSVLCSPGVRTTFGMPQPL